MLRVQYETKLKVDFVVSIRKFPIRVLKLQVICHSLKVPEFSFKFFNKIRSPTFVWQKPKSNLNKSCN